VVISIAAAVLAFVAVAGLASYLFTQPLGAGVAERRLSRLNRPVEKSDRVAGEGLLRTGNSRVPLLRLALARTAASDRWRLDLEQAGLRIRVSEYLLIRLLAGVILTLLILLVAGASLTGILVAVLGFFAGFLAPSFYVQMRKSRRRDEIGGQLVEMLEMLSNSLRSGFALSQAFELAAKQLKPPIKNEIEAMISDMSLGAQLEDALRDMAERTGSIDAELMVTSILVQRTSGGNLSEVLDNVAATIREREHLQREIKALTASQRLTGMILSLWPVLLGVLFFIMAPSLMEVLWTEELGRVLLAVAVSLQLLAVLSMRQILKLEV
jgi:tight adherence protein B